MNKPQVSVIIPVYNVERHLKRCVKSIIAQGLADYEVILIDDGSTDDTAQVVADAHKTLS